MGISSPVLEFILVRTFLGPPAWWFRVRAGFGLRLAREGSSLSQRSRFAKQVIHKRDGPKLPHQAVMIQQSAMHLEGRNALLS